MVQHARLAVLFALVALVAAEQVQIRPCDFPTPGNCTVHNVFINPCAEAETNDPCRLKKGKAAAISFDFTPDRTSAELVSRPYWVGAMGKLPWLGMDNDACHYTTCPTVGGTRQFYNYTLDISKKYSARIYQIEWRLWDEEETMQCCFMTKIRLY